jgi:hypothetical protein
MGDEDTEAAVPADNLVSGCWLLFRKGVQEQLLLQQLGCICFLGQQFGLAANQEPME